jgi:hypothetical protein
MTLQVVLNLKMAPSGIKQNYGSARRDEVRDALRESQSCRMRREPILIRACTHKSGFVIDGPLTPDATKLLRSSE